MCVCVRERMCVCICVCVCVWFEAPGWSVNKEATLIRVTDDSNYLELTGYIAAD